MTHKVTLTNNNLSLQKGIANNQLTCYVTLALLESFHINEDCNMMVQDKDKLARIIVPKKGDHNGVSQQPNDIQYMQGIFITTKYK